MKANFSLISAIILGLLFLSCSVKLSKNEFYLYGTVQGMNTKSIVLAYSGFRKTIIVDTLEVINNKFFTYGYINGATRALIKFNNMPNSKDDQSDLFIFLEPKKIGISQAGNNFKNVNITGSSTQLEIENFEKKIKSNKKELAQFRVLRNKLVEQLKVDKDSINISNSIKTIDSIWMIKLSQVEKMKLRYALDHPNSYLSAYFTNNYFTKIPYDSINIYYQNLSPDIRTGLYGVKIKEKINIRKSIKIGDKVPIIKGVDFFWNQLDLEEFNGKYVLLDFWASWCKSCRKNIPDVKKLYNKYHENGLEIISISLDDDKSKWRKAIKNENIEEWNHILSGRSGEISREYNISLIPDYILIDKNQKIIYRGIDKEALKKIETILNQKIN